MKVVTYLIGVGVSLWLLTLIPHEFLIALCFFLGHSVYGLNQQLNLYKKQEQRDLATIQELVREKRRENSYGNDLI